jgi:CRISPR-associated protein Csm3
LFGSTGKDDVRAGRLLFYDMILLNKDELEKAGVSETEVKFENSIQRLTAVANPRQIERAVRGSKFQMDLIYTMDAKVTQEILLEDFKTIRDGFRLLTFDYLGGNGSRGYGRVNFDNLATECVVGNVEDSIVNKLNSILKG